MIFISFAKLRFLLLNVLSILSVLFIHNMAFSQAEFDILAKQAILIDVTSGQTLFEKNADQQVPPASMTKIMTSHLIFDRLHRGLIKLDDQWLVSEKAWRKGGSKMFLELGKYVSVQDILHGIIIQSGNDATIVAAEALAGSEEAFAELMTAKARELGMDNTSFLNASGWPDDGHYSTARDLAKLAMATMARFPEYYNMYALREFTYNGIKQVNRNPILGTVPGVDGIKTGHVEIAGYGLVGSAIRNDRRLLLVVHGLSSEQERREESAKLLEYGYQNWGYYRYFNPGDTLHEVPVWLGQESRVAAQIDHAIGFNLTRGEIQNLTFHVKAIEPLSAPIVKGQSIATLELRLKGQVWQSYPLVAGTDVAKLGALDRISAAFKYLILGE